MGSKVSSFDCTESSSSFILDMNIVPNHPNQVVVNAADDENDTDDDRIDDNDNLDDDDCINDDDNDNDKILHLIEPDEAILELKLQNLRKFVSSNLLIDHEETRFNSGYI